MTDAPATLHESLKTATMLEIDGLHAWDFFLGDFLTLECMDGRDRKTWRFSLEQIHAATFDAALQSWTINDGTSDHSLKCLDAFTPSNDVDELEEDGSV
ncbi:hypothetical protein AFK24_11915 [Pseudomonas syringae]|uniref:DUF5629 domain-containing protein n=1 Tax=Pseudomonas syringae TaxID=317 RepID=A0A1C7Z4T6_PSESX|nr:DUF5629 family protein [Pseudomonas syringae]OCR24823.1 hypothetical protein AFK24_11915 [Pseudomonas syringae]